MSSNRKKQLAVFDLDRTLVRKNSSFSFCFFLYRRGFFSLKDVCKAIGYRILFQTGSITLEELHRGVFRSLLQGASYGKLAALALEFLDSFLPKQFYTPAVKALQEAQKLGCHTAILSNSPDFLVLPIARALQVPYAAGTVYEVDKDGSLCNIAELMEGTTKARFLMRICKEQGIAKEDVTVYTDSHHDLPLLLQAGRCVAVNPDCRLKRIARKRHWSVI